MTEIQRDVVVSGTDRFGVRGEFYNKPVFDKAASDAEGRPIYTNKVYIKIQADHDNKTGWDLPLKDPDKYAKPDDDPRNRWDVAFKQFEQGVSGKAEGTPLEVWNMLPKHRCLELAAQGILSMEQLANLPDNMLQKVGPDGSRLRDGAKRFLEPADMMTQSLRNTVADQEKELENLKAQMTQLQNQRFGDEEEMPPPKRGPGRPKRAT